MRVVRRLTPFFGNSTVRFGLLPQGLGVELKQLASPPRSATAPAWSIHRMKGRAAVRPQISPPTLRKWLPQLGRSLGRRSDKARSRKLQIPRFRFCGRRRVALVGLAGSDPTKFGVFRAPSKRGMKDGPDFAGLLSAQRGGRNIPAIFPERQGANAASTDSLRMLSSALTARRGQTTEAPARMHRLSARRAIGPFRA
jgi:hypothetical protein